VRELTYPAARQVTYNKDIKLLTHLMCGNLELVMFYSKVNFVEAEFKI